MTTILSRRPWAFERGTLWALDCHLALVPAVTPRVEATFGEVKPDGAPRLAAAMGLGDTAPVLRRFEVGSRCFAAWVDGEIVAYGWVSQDRERIGELERTFHMRRGEAYIWDCVTLPPYRRLGLYAALLGRIALALQAAGFSRVWIGASVGNRPSLRGFATAGFQPVIKLTYARLLWWEYFWIGEYPTASRALVAEARQSLLAKKE